MADLPSIQSEFNSGLAIIYQLDTLEKGLIEATVSKNYEMHYRVLLSYYKTLYPHMKQKERDKHNEIWMKIKKNLDLIKDKVQRGKHFIPSNLLDEFDFWEMELRDAKQSHGLGMPKRDPRFAMAGG